MLIRLLIIFILLFSVLSATIDQITLELIPANLLITGGFVDIHWEIKQTNPQPPELTFFREGPCGTNQSLLSGLAAMDLSSGSHVISLCDGDRVLNKIFAIGRETTSSILVPASPTLEIISDTIPPDPPNIDDESNDFPKTVYTDTFQVRGNVDNSNPEGNATDKPETGGSVTIFYNGTDPVTGQPSRVVIGGGLIQPNSKFVATVDLTGIAIGQSLDIFIVATDTLGHESSVKTLGKVTRGTGGNVHLKNLSMEPRDKAITNHNGVMLSGQVIGTVKPFKVKIYMDGVLNSEIAGLKSGDKFSHTVNMTTEGVHCFAAEAENSNTPIYKGGMQSYGCVELDLTSPLAPQILNPNPASTLITKGPAFHIRGIMEQDKNLTNTLKPKLYLSSPTDINFSPLSPIEITTSGNFLVSAEIQDLPDGQHSIELKAVDEVGNTGPGSISRVSFIKDTQSPLVEEVKLNGVIVPQNLDLFLPSSSIQVEIRLSEDSVSAPTLKVKPNHGSQFSAGLFGGSGKIWTYSFSIAKNLDGPLSLSVEGGGDQAGNTISFSQEKVAIVDTKPAALKTMIPTERSVLSQKPKTIRLTFEDVPFATDFPSSGVDTTSAIVRMFNPKMEPITVALTQFDPVTIDVEAEGDFVEEGDYRVEVIISDKAGNQSLKDIRLITMDYTKIPEDHISCFPANNSFARYGVAPFEQGSDHYVEVRVNNSEFDPNPSSLVLKNYKEIPQLLAGTKSISTHNSVIWTLDEKLPSDHSKDGQYVMESQIYDLSGNLTKDHVCVFTYDNCAPSVSSVFPEDKSSIGRNLRHASAIMRDCQPRFDVEISDIDPAKSTIRLIQLPRVVNGTPTGNEVEILSRLRYESQEGERAKKVLLEIIDKNGLTTSLANDGSADGEYRLEIQAFDRSGNSSPISSSTFVYDTQDPYLLAENLQENMVLLADEIHFYGKARDNNGGSGLDRIEVQIDSLAGELPVTTLIPFRKITVGGVPLPPYTEDPPFQNWNTIVKPEILKDTPARITFRVYDKALNYRDFSYKVLLMANRFRAPIKSEPLNNFSTSSYFINFRWEPVENAISYEVEIITPNQNSKIFPVSQTSTKINIASLSEGEGVYHWNVRAMDSHGNSGTKTLNTKFKIDQSGPKVTAIQIQDPSPESKGRITQGETRFLITFSENMNTTTIPVIKLVPVDKGTFSELPLQVIAYNENTLLAKIRLYAPSATEKSPYGMARLEISGATDPGNNSMQSVDPGLNLFEINAGPWFDIRFFTNPVDQDHITFAIKGFTNPNGQPIEIIQAPSIVVYDKQSNELALSPQRLTESAFICGFHLSLIQYSNVNLTISGTDKYGNTNTRAFYIPITTLRKSQSTTLSTSKLRLSFPEGSLESDENLAFLPNLDNQNFQKLRFIEMIAAPHKKISLQKSAAMEVLSTSSLDYTTRSGYYILENKSWKWLGKTNQSLLEISGALGPVAVFEDVDPPVFEKRSQKGQFLEFRLMDNGSGIDAQASVLETDSGQSIQGEWDHESGKMVYQIPAGVESARLKVFDSSGNFVKSSLLQVQNQNPKLEAFIYPNPAKNRLNYTIRTNVLPNSAEMYVYDVSGSIIYKESLNLTQTEERFSWDLLSENLNPVANGVYFLKLRLNANGESLKKTLKFAVLK